MAHSPICFYIIARCIFRVHHSASFVLFAVFLSSSLPSFIHCIHFAKYSLIIMSSRSMGAGQQVVRPPQRGIFPLDHERSCSAPMEQYLDCLAKHDDRHYQCQDFSKLYLQCRMENGLMSQEDLNNLGYAHKITTAKEYDLSKEKEGFVAGKHINQKRSWFGLSSSPSSMGSTDGESNKNNDNKHGTTGVGSSPSSSSS